MSARSATLPLTVLAAWVGASAGWTHGFRAFTSYSAALIEAGELPRQAPKLAYVDQQGVPGAVGQPNAKFRLLQLFYLRCPEACPIAMGKTHAILNALEPALKQRLEIVSLSVDHDSTQAVRSMWVAHGSPEQWTMASLATESSEDEFRQLGALVIRRADGLINHSLDLFLVDPAGSLVAVFPPDETPAHIAAAIAGVSAS